MDASPPPDDFVRAINRTRRQPSQHGFSLTGSGKFDAIDDFIASEVDISSLPSSSSTLPAVSSSSRKTGQLWADAYRPHTADACLGNEANATYLLEWLRRLLVAASGSVRTTDKRKKHAVQRRVDRSKKRKRATRGGYSDESDDDMADFIVDDDEDEDAVGEYDEEIDDEEWFGKFRKINRHTADDTPASSQGTDAAAAAAAAAPALPLSTEKSKSDKLLDGFASLDKLTNCILLTGPSGSCKTATVYACASSLGYEVFELYPGMGKRSGKELLSAVGDLARNHMVSSGGVGGGATFKPTHTTSSSAASSTGGEVRQSLILIEEADILFEEDKGFWSAVVELVSESKRPVVIVCNDVELVPRGDLPLQEELEFEKPPVKAVVPWLQSVAARADGRYLTSTEVESFVKSLPGTDLALDEDSEREVGVDIRQAMHQLQFGHFASPPSASSSSQDIDAVSKLVSLGGAGIDMKSLARAAESISLACLFEHALYPSAQDVEVWGESSIEHSAPSSASSGTASTTRQWGTWTQLVPQPLAWQQQRAALSSGGVELDYRGIFADLHARIYADSTTATNAGPKDVEVGMDIGSEAATIRLETLQTHQSSLTKTLLKPLLLPSPFLPSFHPHLLFPLPQPPPPPILHGDRLRTNGSPHGARRRRPLPDPPVASSSSSL